MPRLAAVAILLFTFAVLASTATALVVFSAGYAVRTLWR